MTLQTAGEKLGREDEETLQCRMKFVESLTFGKSKNHVMTPDLVCVTCLLFCVSVAN